MTSPSGNPTRTRAWLLLMGAGLIAAATLSAAGCRPQTPADLGTPGGTGNQTGRTGTQQDGAGDQTGQTDQADPYAKYNPKKGFSTEKAVIVTNRGTIVFGFYSKEAPKTVASFKKLAAKGFFNGSKFHRVEPGFVIQGGDPLSKDSDAANDGTGGPGYTIPDEFNNHLHVAGAVAMAHTSQPNSGGSQFYITLNPQPSLDNQYSVFGYVVKGVNVVKKIRKGDVMKRVYIAK